MAVASKLCMCGRPVNSRHLGYLHVDITYSQFIFIFSVLIYIYVAGGRIPFSTYAYNLLHRVGAINIDTRCLHSV